MRGPGGDHQAIQGVALRLLLHGTPGELGLVETGHVTTVTSSDWSRALDTRLQSTATITSDTTHSQAGIHRIQGEFLKLLDNLVRVMEG